MSTYGDLSQNGKLAHLCLFFAGICRHKIKHIVTHLVMHQFLEIGTGPQLLYQLCYLYTERKLLYVNSLR